MEAEKLGRALNSLPRALSVCVCVCVSYTASTITPFTQWFVSTCQVA